MKMATLFCILGIFRLFASCDVWGQHPDCLMQLKFDEKSGAVCTDSSGRGNDALVASAKRVGDESGGALECDGSANGAVAAGLDRLRLGQGFAIAAWVNLTVEPKDMKGPWPSIVYRFAPGAMGFRLGFIRESNSAFFKWDDGTSIHGYGISSKREQWGRGWHHFVGVFSSRTRLYVDGEEASSAPLVGGFKDGGGQLVVGHGGFTGIVDEVVLYNRALSKEEVQALYMSGRADAGRRNVRTVAVKSFPPKMERPARSHNLIEADGSFESGIDHHWEASGARLERGAAFHGAACVVLDAADQPAQMETSDITVDVSKPYTLSAFMRGKGKAVLQIISVHPNDPYDGNWAKSQSVSLSDSWKRFTLTLEPGWNWTNKWSDVPRSGHKFRAAISAEKGAVCYVDAMQFEEGKEARNYAPPAPAFISVSSGKPGNVFLVGEPTTLTFSLYAPRSGAASLHCSIKDCWGATLYDRTEPVKFSPEGTAQVTMQPSIQKKGFFKVAAELVQSGSQTAQTDFTFCIVPPPRPIPPQDSFFGLQGPVSAEWAEAMRRIGVKWFRMGIGWGWVERKRGEFHWDTTEERVNLLHEKGMGIMGLVSSTPEWARGEIPKDEWRTWAYPPRDVRDLENFMEQAARRLGGRVDCWEIWNESCLDYFKVNPALGKSKSEAYAEVLKAAYRGAKRGNPPCTVCTNPITNKFVPFGEEVLSHAPDAFDVLNVHPYTGRVRIGLGPVTTPEEFGMRQFLLDAAALTRKKARGQEVWNSEQGFTLDCDAAPDSDFARDFAKYLARSLLLQRATPIRRAFWFLTYDRRMCNNRKGMWRHGMQPLPVVAAYATLAWVLDGPTKVRELRTLKGASAPLCAFAFQKTNGSVAALWLPAADFPDQLLTFKAPGPTIVLDIMGNTPEGATQVQEQWSVPLSDSPIYIVSEGISCERLATALEGGAIVEVAPAPLRVSRASHRITVDGRFDEWPASALALWDEDRIYFAFKLAQKYSAPIWSGNLLRQGNCLCLRIGPKNDCQELLIGLSYTGPQVYRSRGAHGLEAGLVAEAEAAVSQDDALTRYEIAIPFSALAMPKGRKGASMDLRWASICEGKEETAAAPVRLQLEP